MNEETKVKTKSKKGLVAIIIAVILLIAIICGGIYYYKVYSETDVIFKRAIDNSIKAYQEEIQEEEYKTINTKIGANFKLELDEDNDEEAKIIDFINALNVELNVQMDRENKQIVAKLDSKYENDNLLNADVFVDVEDKKMYMYLKDIFNKYIETDIEDEIDEDVTNIFNSIYANEDKENLIKASKIIGEELKNIIKKENCNREKVEITINNEKKNVNKNKISMTYEQLLDEFETICTNLKNNQEFINCYKEKEEVEKFLEELIEKIQDEKEYDYEDVNVEISLYTTGMLQKFVKLDMLVQENEELVKLEITKKDEKSYEFKFIHNDEDLIKLDVKKINDNEFSSIVEANIPDTGKITMDFDISCKLNEEIDRIDTTNIVKVEDIAEEDVNTILENFGKTKLYELIDEMSGGIFGNALMNKSQLDEEYRQEDKQVQEWLDNYDEAMQDYDEAM